MKKITHYRNIILGYNIIGYLQLVEDSRGNDPQIEFELDEAFRDLGIMSEELPIYLNDLLLNQIYVVNALVKKDNIASRRVLEKCGFEEISEISDQDIICYQKELLKKVEKGLDIVI
jgi:RimJ/RimL family protein N-acetyltransferase